MKRKDPKPAQISNEALDEQVRGMHRCLRKVSEETRQCGFDHTARLIAEAAEMVLVEQKYLQNGRRVISLKEIGRKN